MTRYEELKNKWSEGDMTFSEIEEYADLIILQFQKMNEYNTPVEEFYDSDTLLLIYFKDEADIIEMQTNYMDDWYSILYTALFEENYELCQKIKIIVDNYEEILIFTIYLFRRELYSFKFLRKIYSINELNNKIVSQ